MIRLDCSGQEKKVVKDEAKKTVEEEADEAEDGWRCNCGTVASLKPADKTLQSSDDRGYCTKGTVSHRWQQRSGQDGLSFERPCREALSDIHRGAS